MIQKGVPGSEKETAPLKRVALDLWPTVGQMLGLKKSSTYQAAERGEIPTVRFGKQIKVPVVALDELMASATKKAA